MCNVMVKKTVALLLIQSFAFSEAVPTLSTNEREKIRVAFVGISFEKVDSWHQKRIVRRVTEMLGNERALQVMAPDKVGEEVGEEEVATFLASLDKESFAEIAERLKMDHIFAGKLINQTPDPNRLLLVGNMIRYDVHDNQMYRFEILKYYEGFGVEVLRIKQELVDTITPARRPQTHRSVVSLFVVLIIAALIAMAFVGGKAVVKGDTDGNGGETPL